MWGFGRTQNAGWKPFQDKPALQMEQLRPAVGFDRSRDGGRRVRTNTDAEELTGEAVEEAAGAFELGEEFFFGAAVDGIVRRDQNRR